MSLNIAGIIKSSLIDFPGKTSTVIFLGGCNFRCGYCHNPEMVQPSLLNSARRENLKQEEVIEFLVKRKRFLDGVCISGGEPTLQKGLIDFIKEIKKINYKIKLDTNGSNFFVLQELIKKQLLDFVAMDIKGPYKKYEKIISCNIDLENIKASSELLRKMFNEDKLLSEFRTTVCREQLSFEDLKEMVKEHPNHPSWYFQKFNNPGQILDMKNTYSPYEQKEMEKIGEKLCVNVR